MRLLMLASAAILLGAAAPAVAQDMVGTDSIIKSLVPNAGVAVGKTRGIKHATAPASANAPADASASAPPANTMPAASLPVLFATGSADLSPAGREQLDKLGAALKNPQLSASHFRIEGHTDTTGDDQSNQALSERRANAVVDYLTTHYGINRGQLAAVGMGKQGLAVPTPDQTAEPRNRRVLVVNLDG